MKTSSKSLALLLVIALTASRLSFAQSVTQPSVPNFTVKYVDSSYQEPDTYTKNGYTGETITHHGNYVWNQTIFITIKNQPFVSTKLDDGNYTQLWYSVKTKGHYEDWTPNVVQGPTPRVKASDSVYTVIPISLQDYQTQLYDIGQGSVVDIQVKAFVGHPVTEYYPFSFDHIAIYYEALTESEWSNIQTVSIGETSPSPSVPEFPVLAILPLIVVIPLIGIRFLKTKNKMIKNE